MATPDLRLFSKHQRSVILLRANFQCENCNVRLTARTFHADHRHPHSQGGKTLLHNAQALCASCNLKKGDRVE